MIWATKRDHGIVMSADDRNQARINPPLLQLPHIEAPTRVKVWPYEVLASFQKAKFSFSHELNTLDKVPLFRKGGFPRGVLKDTRFTLLLDKKDERFYLPSILQPDLADWTNTLR